MPDSYVNFVLLGVEPLIKLWKNLKIIRGYIYNYGNDVKMTLMFIILTSWRHVSGYSPFLFSSGWKILIK